MFDYTALHQYLNLNIHDMVVDTTSHQFVWYNVVIEISHRHHNFQNSHSIRTNFPTTDMDRHYTVQVGMSCHLVAHMHLDPSFPNRLEVLFEILCRMRLSKNPRKAIDSMLLNLRRAELNESFYTACESARQKHFE